MAQYDLSGFRKLTAENGLSDNLVNAIVQDDKGFIWVATSNGLNRFDGHQFDTYYTSSGLVNGTNIKRLRKFPGNKIGVLSSKGFSVIDAGSVKARSFIVPDSTTLWFDMNQVTDAVPLQDGGYLFTSTTGLYSVDKDGQFTSRYEHFSLQNKLDNKERIFFGNTIFPVSNKDYLLYYQDVNLGYFNADKKEFSLHKTNLPEKWKNFQVPQDNWTIKKQVSKDEYIFLSFIQNRLSYYNRATNKKFDLRLPFKAVSYFYWDSYVSFINDSVFAINCHRNGFYLFTLDRANERFVLHPAIQLPGVECRDIFADKDGRLWVATAEGILMEQKKNPDFSWRYTSLNEGQDAEYFNTCVVKSGHKIFVGRYAWDNGLLVYDDRNGSLLKKINFYSNNSRYNGVMAMQCYYRDTIWVSTEQGLFWVNANNYQYGSLQLPAGIEPEGIRFFPPRKDGIAWMLNYFSNEVARYDITTRNLVVYNPASNKDFPVMRPKFIVYDSYGDCWVAGNGICRWNHRTGKFDTWIKQFAGKYPLEDRVTSITADDNGHLWLTTIDNGILQYSIREKSWRAFTEKDGLPSPVVGTFSPFLQNGFWFASTSNLYYLTVRGDSIAINISDLPLPKKNITSENLHYYYDTAQDRMYFAVRNILSEFNVSTALNRKALPVIIKQVAINNQAPVHFPADTLYLSYQEQRVAIQPGIIDFENLSPWQFKYSINEGIEYDLSVLNPVILLDQLPPGSYKIRISVKGAATSTSAKTILLIVKPPFWKTTWFYLLVVTLSSLLLFGLYRIRVKNIRRKAVLNQRLAEFEMKALHAQMNPHFIFNCLNSIKGLIVNNQNKEASQYLNKFSVLVRKNLDHSRSQFITLKENIDYLTYYIDIENYRFGNINYSIETTGIPDTEDILIAPMLLQPLVENAIWHGLQGHETQLSISFTQTGERITCRIEDNGIGVIKAQQQKPEGGTNSVGLKNIRERISLLNQKFGLDYSLSIQDRSTIDAGSHGTLVILGFISK